MKENGFIMIIKSFFLSHISKLVDYIINMSTNILSMNKESAYKIIKRFFKAKRIVFGSEEFGIRWVLWNGRKHGEWEIFDKDANITSSISYKNGKRHGSLLEYSDRTGEVIKSIDYINGIIHGYYLIYDEDCNLKIQTQFVNGLRHGQEVWYSSNKKIILYITWIKGLKHGLEVSYFDSGNIRSIIPWFKNRKHGHVHEYYNLNPGTFHLAKCIPYLYGLKTGPEITYNFDQEPIKLIPWVNDKQLGSALEYDDTEIPVEIPPPLNYSFSADNIIENMFITNMLLNTTIRHSNSSEK